MYSVSSLRAAETFPLNPESPGRTNQTHSGKKVGAFPRVRGNSPTLWQTIYGKTPEWREARETT